MMPSPSLPLRFVPTVEAQRCLIGPVRHVDSIKDGKSSKDQRNSEEGGNASCC